MTRAINEAIVNVSEDLSTFVYKSFELNSRRFSPDGESWKLENSLNRHGRWKERGVCFSKNFTIKIKSCWILPDFQIAHGLQALQVFISNACRGTVGRGRHTHASFRIRYLKGTMPGITGGILLGRWPDLLHRSEYASTMYILSVYTFREDETRFTCGAFIPPTIFAVWKGRMPNNAVNTQSVDSHQIIIWKLSRSSLSLSQVLPLESWTRADKKDWRRRKKKYDGQRCKASGSVAH